MKQEDAEELLCLYDQTSECTQGDGKYTPGATLILRDREQMRRYILEALIADTRPVPPGLR